MFTPAACRAEDDEKARAEIEIPSQKGRIPVSDSSIISSTDQTQGIKSNQIKSSSTLLPFWAPRSNLAFAKGAALKSQQQPVAG